MWFPRLFLAVVLAAAAQEILTNEAILKMVKSGLGENLIVSMIQGQPGRYSLTPDELLKLKEQGVSEKILTAMAAKRPDNPTQAAWLPGANPSGATLGNSAASGDPNDPMASHDSGIYLYTKSRDGAVKMVPLERAAYQGTKTGGIIEHVPFKSKTRRAVLPGPRAGIRTIDLRPEFYFYFEDKAAALGKTYFGIQNLSNPNQFELIKLDVTKANRETVVMEVNALGDLSTGSRIKAIIPFKADRLRPGLYKVVPTTAMEPGEYCFLASAPYMGALGAGTIGAVDIFDFGVSSDQ